MKKYALKVISAFLIAGIIISLTGYFNNQMDNVVKTIAINNASNVSAGSCNASGTGTTYYTVGNYNVRTGAGTGYTIVDTLDKCTAVKVYCETNGWGKVSISSDKYIIMSGLTKDSCSGAKQTAAESITFTASGLTLSPSTIYYTNDFTASMNLTGITNLPSNSTGKISVNVFDGAGNDVSSSFNISKNYNFDNKSMSITITNKGNVSPGTYTVKVVSPNKSATKTFTINKREFYFDMSLGNNQTPTEDEENTWRIDLSNLTPSNLTMNDFNIQIVNSSGQDKTSSFTITKSGTTAYITNKRRIIRNWEDTVSDYAAKGTYTIKVTLANTTDYASNRVPNYQKTTKITINEVNKRLEEDPNLRINTRYRITYSRSDYRIEVVGTRKEYGNTYYIINEIDIKTNAVTTKEYLLQDLKETYPNLTINQVYFEPKYNNQVALKFSSISVVNYVSSTGMVTYYTDSSSTPETIDQVTFASLYPTAYGELRSGTYSFTATGDLVYPDSGVGTKVIKNIALDGPYQPFAITGGEIKMTVDYQNFTKTEMNNITASLKREGTSKDIITNATDTSTGTINDSHFSLQVDSTSGKSKNQLYIKITFNGSGDEYIGNYYVRLKVGNKTSDIYFNLQDAPTDYYVYSEYDSHAMDSDALPAQVAPYSNRNYEYYIGVYMQKSKVDITEIEKKSIGYRVFDHRVSLDASGNEYFFDEIEYVVKMTRIADGKVYYSLSLDNGEHYTNNLSLTIAEFAQNYEEAYEYIKDYSAGKTTLKYYNLDANGYIISDNFPMHVIRTFKDNNDDLDMSVEYTTDSVATVQSALMDDDFKHANSTMYALIATRFSYDSNNRYVLGAIRGRHENKTDEEGNPIVGHEVSDQFYVTINDTTDPKKTVEIIPKTEVAPGSYYIYLTHNGSQSVGYIFQDTTPDAAIDKDIYPELWMRNIHMTEFKYSNPFYDVTFEEPKISNAATDFASAYTNVESYIDLDFTLDYIYDLTNYNYRIEYNNNGKWIDASEYFEVVSDILPTLSSADRAANVLQTSNIHLTTKVGTTKKGTYRVVMTYENNGYKMTDKIQTFEVNGNHYGININNDYDNDYYFYHNFASSIKIPIEGYSANNVDAFTLKIAYTPDDTTKIYYNWDRNKRTFTDNAGLVHFTYNYTVEHVDDTDLIYTVELRNYNESNSLPIDLALGKYSFEVEYQEDGGELATASTTFEVKEDTYFVIIDNQQPYATEIESGIKLDIESHFISYNDLDDLSYTVYYFDPNQRKYIDVSDVDAETRMFTITDTWEDRSRGLENEVYNGNIYLHINDTRIDLDGIYYIAAYYQEELVEEYELSNLRDLFAWEILENNIHGSFELDGKTNDVEGFYNNISNTYLDIKLDTPHTNNAKYLITQDCSGYTCSPTLASNYNDRFELVSQDATSIKLKYKDDLGENLKLQPGKYQLVVYYGENDYKISDFVVQSEYVDIRIEDTAIRTKIATDKYVANKLFSNKDSSISVATRIFGVDYDKVNIKLTNSDQSTNYERYFIIDRDNFYDTHMLEITYKATEAIPSGDYLLMIYYTDADGKIIEDHTNLTFSSVYYNFDLTGVSYDPNPASPNYENGGNVLIDVETDDLLNKTVAENTAIRQQMINNAFITSDTGEDVTSKFTKSVVTTNSESNFKLNLKYEKDTLEPGEYTATMTYTLQGYTITHSINFRMGDYERNIKITGVEIKSNTPDGKIHNNHGGSYIVNYESNYQIFTNDLDVLVTNEAEIDVTDCFEITKNTGNVEVKYVSNGSDLDKGTYTISLIYTDPETHNVDTETTEVFMYGYYKEITIKDIKANVTPIIAENSDQYYTFNLVTSNLTREELDVLGIRVYDDYGNIVYSNITTDNSPNYFGKTKISDEEYRINILPYQARVGKYYVVVCLSDGYDDYYESNRLELTVDDTLYKVDLIEGIINPLEKINNTDNIYDYIGVDGLYNFNTTHPNNENTSYSIKVFSSGVLAKETTITPNYVDNYQQAKFQIDDLSVFGDIEFALCINGLPYTSITKEVLEYIKVTNVSVVVDYQDVIDSVSLNQGDTKTFELVVEPANATNKNLIFTSLDSNVAVFDGNKVTIKGPGSTTIRVHNKEYQKEFTINVNNRITSNVYEIDYTNKTIFVKKMTTKSINKTTFINNLQNVASDYKMYDNNNNLISSAVANVGTTYKLVSANDTYTIIIKGDTNCDGEVDMADANIAYRIYRGKVQSNAYLSKAADVIEDNDIGMDDINKIYRFYQGRINEI